MTYRREESHCLGYDMTIRDSALRSKETGKCSEIPSSQSFLDALGYGDCGVKKTKDFLSRIR